ncbi:MAG: aspartate carbamoyltransferase regulatory subunit [Candidatus Aenigmarchaeota archaeon]|nr:aspartate carbamoyltransferase regulatory subunit [Candidatus Aenigmarchaeota archaeon]
MKGKTFKISAIKEGTVIDHISADHTFKVVDILNLKGFDNVVTVGMNLESKKLGKKGLIKIGGRHLTKEEVDMIAIIAPKAKINIIKDYNVKDKFRVKIPNVIHNIIKCANTNCVTNVYKVPTKFHVLKGDPLKIRCHYCERLMDIEEVEMV